MRIVSKAEEILRLVSIDFYWFCCASQACSS
jgi:hypothetical protein